MRNILLRHQRKTEKHGCGKTENESIGNTVQWNEIEERSNGSTPNQSQSNHPHFVISGFRLRKNMLGLEEEITYCNNCISGQRVQCNVMFGNQYSGRSSHPGRLHSK